MSELIYDDEDGALDQRIRRNWRGGQRRVANIAVIPRGNPVEESEEEGRVNAKLAQLVKRQAEGRLNAGVEVELFGI
jgi:hypothetical protein